MVSNVKFVREAIAPTVVPLSAGSPRENRAPTGTHHKPHARNPGCQLLRMCRGEQFVLSVIQGNARAHDTRGQQERPEVTSVPFGQTAALQNIAPATPAPAAQNAIFARVFSIFFFLNCQIQTVFVATQTVFFQQKLRTPLSKKKKNGARSKTQY
jgi:hypothetical protein